MVDQFSTIIILNSFVENGLIGKSMLHWIVQWINTFITNIKPGEEYDFSHCRNISSKSSLVGTSWRRLDYSSSYWYNAYTPH
jgi:hypothetical protein